VARADSTVRVNIIGDAKSLTRAADKAEGSVAGMNKTLLKAGGVIAGAFVTDALVDFGATALKEADRVGDATGRIETHLGNLAQPLIDTADDFAKIGASKGDMLDLEAAIIDIGTALQISNPELASMADESAQTAAALALITDTDADTWIQQIGKAAGGSEKALKALGISVTDAEIEARALAMTGKDTADALTEGEKSAAALELVLEKLNPRIQETITGTGDLEQKQSELQARMETLQSEIGGALEGPLNDLLGWVLAGIDGWQMLADRLEVAGVDFGIVKDYVLALVAPLTLVTGLVDDLIDTLTHLDRVWGGIQIPGTGGGGNRPPSRNPGAAGWVTTVNVQGGSPETIERAVRDAIRTTARRG
jgi:hypothetical protein